MRIVRDRQLKAGRDTKEFIHFILLKKKGEKSQKECVGEIGEKKKKEERRKKERAHLPVCMYCRKRNKRKDRQKALRRAREPTHLHK